MNALVVEDFKKLPRWSEFAEPKAADDGEAVVQVTASALSNLVKAIASGAHYSSGAALPFVPGVDGTGRLADGTRVYFFQPRRPFGALGERSLARKALCIPLPDSLSDLEAAALANPVMSSWAALTRRARFQPGESVLVNGATGTSGKLAVRVARQLGARRVVATGRDAAVLASLGADQTISLHVAPAELAGAMAAALRDHGVSVILDYLWGPSAEALIAAIGKAHAPAPLRFVQIGSMAGNTIPLPAFALRSSALELMGSGLGSVSDLELVRSIGEAFAVAETARFSVETEVVKMSEGEQAWTRGFGRKRLVFTI